MSEFTQTDFDNFFQQLKTNRAKFNNFGSFFNQTFAEKVFPSLKNLIESSQNPVKDSGLLYLFSEMINGATGVATISFRQKCEIILDLFTKCLEDSSISDENLLIFFQKSVESVPYEILASRKLSSPSICHTKRLCSFVAASPKIFAKTFWKIYTEQLEFSSQESIDLIFKQCKIRQKMVLSAVIPHEISIQTFSEFYEKLSTLLTQSEKVEMYLEIAEKISSNFFSTENEKIAVFFVIGSEMIARVCEKGVSGMNLVDILSSLKDLQSLTNFNPKLEKLKEIFCRFVLYKLNSDELESVDKTKLVELALDIRQGASRQASDQVSHEAPSSLLENTTKATQNTSNFSYNIREMLYALSSSSIERQEAALTALPGLIRSNMFPSSILTSL